jgi:hypothetical protein
MSKGNLAIPAKIYNQLHEKFKSVLRAFSGNLLQEEFAVRYRIAIFMALSFLAH